MIVYINRVMFFLFLIQEKKFYLYALYNKNKPNSDSLMSEYGSAFFKVGVKCCGYFTVVPSIFLTDKDNIV